MELEKKLLDLISEYIKCGDYFCKILSEHFQVSESILLFARRQKKIPKEGNVENIYYNFHGVGCYFETSNDQIDIDFGPDGRHDGFDIMRLKHFAESRYSRFSEFEDENILKQVFDILQSKKIIINTKSEPSTHLYYLNKV